MKIKTKRQLKPILAALKSKGRKVVFTNGCFDLIHLGHVRYLEKAKCLGDILVVGVNSDSSLRRLKGKGRPLVPERDRAEIVAAFVCVDFVVIFPQSTPAELINYLQPDILVKGADYRLKDIVGRDTVSSYGGQVKAIPLTKNRSTTRIIRKICQLN